MHFDNLSLEDLIDLTDKNPRYKELIVTHTAFQRCEKVCLVSKIRVRNKIEKDPNNICDFNIYHVGTTARFLRTFGHKISKLSIVFQPRITFPSWWHSDIERLINEFCSDTLKEFVIEGQTENFHLDSTYSWRSPFTQLINLEVKTKITTGGRIQMLGNKNFSEIFPSLRSMTFKMENNSDRIVQHFPHLEQVSLREIGKNELKFIELNPQIRGIEIENHVDNTESVRHMSELLQNLEFIKLGKIEDEALTILMTGMTNLKKIEIATSDDIEKYHNLLNSTWEVEHNGNNGFTFTRK